MKEFCLKGKIIDRNNQPAGELRVDAYEHSFMSSDASIGQTLTELDGTFEIKFYRSRFKEFQEITKEPQVYLVINYDEKTLKTKITSLQKEIEYHIRLVEDEPDPNAVDIYSNSLSRINANLNNSGLTLNNDLINLDAIAKGNLSTEIKMRIQKIQQSFGEAVKNFGDLQALLSGVISSTLQEIHLNTIGYDGPQVPRNVWRDGGSNVIVWPRKEEFEWE